MPLIAHIHLTCFKVLSSILVTSIASFQSLKTNRAIVWWSLDLTRKWTCRAYLSCSFSPFMSILLKQTRRKATRDPRHDTKLDQFIETSRPSKISWSRESHFQMVQSWLNVWCKSKNEHSNFSVSTLFALIDHCVRSNLKSNTGMT
jgi:hypothetical protein